MVAIGIDRYFAIKCPLKNRVNHKKGKLAILLVWVISIGLASVQLFVARMQEDKESDSIDATLINQSTTTLSNLSKSFLNSSQTQVVPNQQQSFQISSSAPDIEISQKEIDSKKYTCNEEWNTIGKQQTYTLFNFFAVYLIPVFILGKII